jgi:hypothetical protein
MRDLVPTLLVLALVPTGCGTDVEVVEEDLEHQIRWQQAPGEIQHCHVFKLDNVRSVEVDRLQVKFPEGSHHVHIYRSTEPEPDQVYDCLNGIDWTKWSLLIGAQTQSMDWQLPEGVTLPLEPHQQLLAQVHWLNTTDQTVDSKIDLSFHTTQESKEHLGVVFGVNQRINVAPGQRSRVQAFCPIPEGAKVHAMMGHFHAYGSDYKVLERMPNQLGGYELYASPDEPGFEFKLFSPAREITRGAGLQYECNYFNWSGETLTWGSNTESQEHCNMTAYYSPADEVSELCLTAPSKLSALTPTMPAVRAGQSFTFDVALTAPEAEAVTVALQASDASALEMPASVTIPAGQQRASFSARTRRPGSFEVSASMGDARVVAVVRVTGLVLSEVFYNPAVAGNNLQWIELANQSDVPLNLSGYSIGAGTSDYLRTRLAMPVTVPARGCIVVGGPASTPANYFPSFALNADLEPNLELGSGQAAGVGLFVTSGMSAAARPLDAVVYGGMNTMLRGPDGQLASVWPGSSPGGSIKRVTDNVWVKSNTPTPGICEVLHAP